ncbi:MULTISPECIES: rod shape-determining protein RodA [Kordiimonas]|jgi:rod shape determining protein RodA|uniref:Peptidoglycan glycosyltransferase MrdB n=1 Tax=Kordiimonas lacus TaxID=637679 RepID=A0A1G7AVZ8_9PROT|nr:MULTISPECIES: rod shape-determining protein RodA [Kordiimonas]SDE18126.1 rod shape determining protein RodA [Kordiimonas lacus]
MGTARMFGPRRVDKNPLQRLLSLNWSMVLINCLIACIGFAMLYSVAGGDWDPWASRQAARFAGALVLMLVIAVIDIRYWMAFAYPAWAIGIGLLLAVEVVGSTGMGGQRWLDIGFMRLQPSELMKIAVVMALARYFHGRNYDQSRSLRSLFVPVMLMLVPVALVYRQPDLGTALMIVMGGMAILFLAGLPAWLFIAAGVAVSAAVPIVWQFLRDYQKDRVLTFLNPEADPLGAGYQITQSKIALGSGGMTGKGFLGGTQSQLNFLPEMKTDFIFTVLAEEFGLIGAVITLLLYGIVLGYGLLMGLGCRSQFGRLMAGGMSITLFLYVMINVAMVMGLMPVVGVPLPMISYGGSAMLTWMIAYGLILSVAIHRHVTLAPKGSGLA